VAFRNYDFKKIKKPLLEQQANGSNEKTGLRRLMVDTK